MVVTVVVAVVEAEAETDDNTFTAEGDADLVCAGGGLATFEAHFRLDLLQMKETWTKHLPCSSSLSHLPRSCRTIVKWMAASSSSRYQLCLCPLYPLSPEPHQVTSLGSQRNHPYSIHSVV